MGRRIEMVGGAVVTGLFSLLILLLFWVNYNDAQDLTAHGVTTQATVSSLWVGQHTKGGAKWQLDYTFPLPGHDPPIPIYKLVELTQEAYGQLRVGQTVPVRYLPTHPSINRLEMPGVVDYNREVGFILLLFLGMTVYFVREARQPQRRR